MSNRTRRKIEQAAQPAAGQPEPVQLIATIRKSKQGQTAVIDAIAPDGTIREIHGTCSGATFPEAIQKAFDIMRAEMAEPQMVKLLVEGRK